MWKPKWFSKGLNLPVENVVYIGVYTFTHPYSHHKQMTLTIHLPSMRVSEKHYDSSGKLERYIHNSPDAEQHIAYLRSQDSKLVIAMKDIDTKTKLFKKTSTFKKVCHCISIASLIILIFYLIGWIK